MSSTRTISGHATGRAPSSTPAARACWGVSSCSGGRPLAASAAIKRALASSSMGSLLVSGSAPGPERLAPLGERLRSFDEVGRRQQAADAVLVARKRVVDAVRQPVERGFLGELQRQRRALEDLL